MAQQKYSPSHLQLSWAVALGTADREKHLQQSILSY